MPKIQQQIILESNSKRQILPSYSRFRRFRSRQKVPNRMTMMTASISNNESATVKEVSGEV